MTLSEHGRQVLLETIEQRIAEIEVRVQQQIALFEELRRSDEDTSSVVLMLRELQDSQAEAQAYRTAIMKLSGDEPSR
jgi:hypothetical protein